LGHTGAIITAVIFSLRSLARQQGISANRGNMYGWWPIQDIDRASTVNAEGSGLQLQYKGSWVLVLEANKSTEKGPSQVDKNSSSNIATNLPVGIYMEFITAE